MFVHVTGFFHLNKACAYVCMCVFLSELDDLCLFALAHVRPSPSRVVKLMSQHEDLEGLRHHAPIKGLRIQHGHVKYVNE